MNKCRFRRFRRGNAEGFFADDYTCDDLRKNIDQMKKDFRDQMIPRPAFKDKQDRAVQEYCDELDNALMSCKCKRGDV